MVLCVLAYPRVTVVDVGLGDVLVDHLRHDDKPLRQEVSLSWIKQKSSLQSQSDRSQTKVIVKSQSVKGKQRSSLKSQSERGQTGVIVTKPVCQGQTKVIVKSQSVKGKQRS